MHIAYITFEHPAGISGGGIGTYAGQIARLMTSRGHQVEVFTATSAGVETIDYDGYIVHRVHAENATEFRKGVLTAFSRRHMVQPFDIIESAEYGADALLVKKQFPDVPLTVKLHTPSFLTVQLNEYKRKFSDKLRFMIGGAIRGKRVKPYWIYRKENDPEFELFQLADSVSSPSHSLKEIIHKEWKESKQIEVVPNVFIPSQDFLDIPEMQVTSGKMVISFFGRLEKRKGILDLMKAIPQVLAHTSNITFRFIGKPHPSPANGKDMVEYMKDFLKDHLDQIRFLGPQPYDRIAALLSETHICVFPSLWENFPNVCLEAMSAGKAVIATGNGGMADMITENVDGILVNPGNPRQLADAIVHLIKEPRKVELLGKAARVKVLDRYNAEKIGSQVEEFYLKTIREKIECIETIGN
jgi:glycosyltransferase involved in cell wall biosynthesis